MLAGTGLLTPLVKRSSNRVLSRMFCQLTFTVIFLSMMSSLRSRHPKGLQD